MVRNLIGTLVEIGRGRRAPGVGGRGARLARSQARRRRRLPRRGSSSSRCSSARGPARAGRRRGRRRGPKRTRTGRPDSVTLPPVSTPANVRPLDALRERLRRIQFVVGLGFLALIVSAPIQAALAFRLGRAPRGRRLGLGRGARPDADLPALGLRRAPRALLRRGADRPAQAALDRDRHRAHRRGVLLRARPGHRRAWLHRRLRAARRAPPGHARARDLLRRAGDSPRARRCGRGPAAASRRRRREAGGLRRVRARGRAARRAIARAGAHRGGPPGAPEGDRSKEPPP